MTARHTRDRSKAPRSSAQVDGTIDDRSAEGGAVIVMSTYNGESYIDDQLESLFTQSFTDWRLLVRDDGSSDRTREIIDDYAVHNTRIVLLESDGRRLGPWASFGLLLDRAYNDGASHVFMCDQDDVWEADKIEAELALMRDAEARHGFTVPLFIHSDLSVVDRRLQPIHPSYRIYQGVSYDHADPLRTLLLHNAVVGCTSVANRALLDAALPLPPGAYHDWWLAQCAAARGEIIDLPRATVRYRYHHGNATGAPGKRAGVGNLLRRPDRFVAAFMPRFNAGLRQAKALQDRLSVHPVEAGVARRIATYLSAFDPNSSYLERVKALWRSGVRPQRRGSYPFLLAIMFMFPRWKRTQPDA
jgi:glycosyltransferase involved in cell wall biosynthesis